jgi:hypothetical protein
MEIINKGLKKCYIIHSTSTGEYTICRVLNEYDNKEEAKNDLIDLLTHKISEKDMLKEFTKKPFF